MSRKRFYIDPDLRPLDLKFAPLVTFVHRYVFTKLEVYMAFLFWENRRHGTDRRTDVRTDRGMGATLNAAR